MPVTEAEPLARDAGDGAAAAQSSALLRVSASKVSRLMDLVGELSLSVSETIHNPALAGLDLTEFEKSAHRLQLVVREVQHAAGELRLVPVGEVFRRMRRMVRELERQTGKEIALVLEGEDTEIDKVLVDRLYEPLVHLMRNAADHGLEPPDERERAGKPRQGRITLAAAQVSGDIRITVADDGRGLNRERILARARERGLAGPEEEPDDTALWKLACLPGFSTAGAVTNLSGRGVGLDVLQTAMKEARGRVAIRNEPGRGMKVVLSIPLTLAFLDSLVMRTGERLYAIPIDAVAEIFQPHEQQITVVHAEGGRETVRVRDAFIPVCRLHRFYGETCVQLTPLEEQVIVVTHTSAGRIGVPVDEMLGQQQAVMKPLLGVLEKVRASSGCALLASGEVAIVLDCEKLVEGTRS